MLNIIWGTFNKYVINNLKIILTYMKKIALIFGITGQDGAYLSKLLLKKK